MITFLIGAPQQVRHLTDNDLLEIANGEALSRAYEARAELQRRALTRNIIITCITIASALVVGLAFFTAVAPD